MGLKKFRQAGLEQSPVPPPSPGEASALRRLALEWRDEWRRDKASGPGIPTPVRTDGPRTDAPKSPDRPRKLNGENLERAKFATSIARAEFGRFYWSGALEKEPAKNGGRGEARSEKSSAKKKTRKK